MFQLNTNGEVPTFQYVFIRQFIGTIDTVASGWDYLKSNVNKGVVKLHLLRAQLILLGSACDDHHHYLHSTSDRERDFLCWPITDAATFCVFPRENQQWNRSLLPLSVLSAC